jgi:hypothetical protein
MNKICISKTAFNEAILIARCIVEENKSSERLKQQCDRIEYLLNHVAKDDDEKSSRKFSNVALVTPEYYRGMEEWYMPVVECPRCNTKVTGHSNYCNNCGVQLKLSTKVKYYVNSSW